MSHSDTVHCPTVTHCIVPQSDTIINISNKFKPDYNTVNHPKSGFDLSRDVDPSEDWVGDAEVILRAQPNPVQRPRRTTPTAEEVSLVDLAMEATETHSQEDKRTFSRIMMELSTSDCQEEIFRFISEKRQGEMKSVRNLPALLVSRFQARRKNPS